MSSCSELLMSLLLCVHVQSLSHVQLFVTPKDCSPPVSLHMEFSRQEYWSGLPFPTPRDLLAMRETWVQYPGCEDPLEKKTGNPLQPSCLENPMDRGPGGLWSIGLQSRMRLSTACSAAWRRKQTVRIWLFKKQAD